MRCINKKIDAREHGNIYVFIKYISSLSLDAFIIIDIIIPFLYFNFKLSAKELVGCAVVFFCTFILFSILHWPRYIKERRG